MKKENPYYLLKCFIISLNYSRRKELTVNNKINKHNTCLFYSMNLTSSTYTVY